MGNRWRSTTGILLLCSVLVACASTPRPAGQPGHGTTSASYDEQAMINRKQAEDATRRLLELAGIPPGAVELASAPAALPGPALGVPASQTYTSVARYWRVPLSFAAVDAFVRAHPPAGLIQEGSSSATVHGMTRHGYAWGGSAPGSSHGGQLSIGVAGPADGQVSYLRVDAGTDWLDPHPVADRAKGPRLRIEAGQSCPASDRAIVGVRNSGADFDTALAPADPPNGGRVCSYAGLNGQAFALLAQRQLPADQAARLAATAHAMDLSHSNAVSSCGMSDLSAAVLVLTYPSRPATNLWLLTSGCSTISNGSIRAGDLGGLAILREAVDGVSG